MAGIYSGNTGGMFDTGAGRVNPVQNLDAVIARLGIGSQAQVREQRTVINELDDIFSELSVDQRKVVESNEEYNVALGALLQKFLFFLIARTQDGTTFVTGPGKKQAQVVLDVTKKITEHIDEMVKDDIKAMRDRMAQLEQVIVQQNKKTQEQESKLVEQAKELARFKESLGDTSPSAQAS